jgi:PrgI family protein
MTHPVRIPADVDREDKVLGNLTARQLLILVVTGTVLYGGWSATRSFLPLPAFAAVALPVAVTAILLAVGQRDGLPLDRLVLAAVQQRMSPRHRLAAPEDIHPAPAWLAERAVVEPGAVPVAAPAALSLPAEAVSETGVIDLGDDGLAVVAICSTVNFALRTQEEQEGLVACFGRYLHSLTAPVQILIRAERLDLSRQIADLRTQAPTLLHPALETAAREHADYLEQLASTTDLLRRQVLLVLREPVHPGGSVDGLSGASPFRRRRRTSSDRCDSLRRAAEARLAQRLAEAVDLLGPSDVTVTPLDPGQAAAVLTAASNPDSLVPTSADLAAPDGVITTAWDYSFDTDPDPWGRP